MPILDPSEPEVDRRAPPTVRRSALGCTKLRDSCHACATSKIKCSREKPSCSKCEARGIECQYFLARRPGRRREGGSAHPTSCTSNSNSSSSTSVSKSIPDSDPHGALSQSGEKTEAMRPTPQHGYTTNGTASSASLPTSNGFLDTPQSLMTEAVLTTDNLLGQHSSDLSSVLADSNMSHLLSDFDPNPNGIDFGMTDYFEHPAISNDEEFSRSLNDIESLLIPKTTNFGLDALDSNEPLTTSFAMSSGVPSLASSVPKSSVTDPNIRMIMHTPTTDMSCGCVTQALDLLKTLSSAQSSPVSSAAGTSPALSSSMAAMGSAQTVLIENKHHIQTVSNLLSCSSCTEDAFRLVIASMIVPKILERHASVARAQALSSRVQDSAEIITGPRPVNSTLSSRQQRGPAEGAEPYIHHDSGR